MNSKAVVLIPIAEIAILNPRCRSQVTFSAIVASIKTVGLKKPITVSPRAKEPENNFRYNLICGQGRIEAFVTLGESAIPAIVTEATREESLLKSLVENIARRPPSSHALYREVRLLKERGYAPEEISGKLGMHVSYVYDLLNLLSRGETKLLQDVEAKRVPLTVAITIANGKDLDIQRALSEAYQNGDLRGERLETVRRIIAQRGPSIGNAGKPGSKSRHLTPAALVKEYERHTGRQKALVRRAGLARRRLLIAISATKSLLADENFLTLLRAESLLSMPEHLAARIKAAGE